MKSQYDLFKKVDYRILRRTADTSIVLCDPTHKNELKNMLQSLGLQEKKHPISSCPEYVFGYGMDKFLIFYNEVECYEILFQIPCYSLTEYYLIPLDKEIQKKAWSAFTIKDGRKWITEDIEMVIRIADAILKEKIFSNEVRIWIEEHKDILKKEDFVCMLERVFFRYTKRLINKMEMKEYDDLYLDYLTFCNY